MFFLFGRPASPPCSQGSGRRTTPTAGANESLGSGDRLRSPAERGSGGRGRASPPGTGRNAPPE
ncbi:Heme chaperone--apocytochrome heme-lyase [Roseomonas mucosa]|nr:Heme chaperone--apocytochrome heme-lyase [Roseomonas mucosa]